MRIEQQLKKLQARIRAGTPTSSEDAAYYAVMPEDLSDDAGLWLDAAETGAMNQTITDLREDLRFEHLREQQARDAVWRFICLSSLHRNENHVPCFISTHARKPTQTTCFLPVEYLALDEEVRVGEVRLLPPDPVAGPGGRQILFPAPCQAVAAVAVEGTETGRMAERARAEAQHALRLLRVGLRGHPSIHDQQLRFRLGDSYALERFGEGWQRRKEAPLELGLDIRLRQSFESQPLATLALNPATPAELQALVALRWLNEARMATDQVVRTLYNFFALEALLGNRSEDQKGLGLTFRRTMLALVISGQFSDPLRLFHMYDQVRSFAVHGEDPPRVESLEHRQFDSNARAALNEYLEFARGKALRRRSHVVAALQQGSEAHRLLAWLRERDRRWDAFALDDEPARRRGDE